MLDGIGVVTELAGYDGGIEPSLRPGRVGFYAQFVVIDRRFWLLLLQGFFGQLAVDAYGHAVKTDSLTVCNLN